MSARISLFGMELDALRMAEAVDQVYRWVAESDHECRYVVTPNVDHAVMFQEHSGLRAAYADASLVLADGAPVVWAARLLRRPLPQRVPGSDLAPALFECAAARGGLSAYLLGAASGVGDRAAANIMRRWPQVRVTGVDSPPPGFERDAQANAAILAKIAAVRPDVLLIGLGAPKQELWVHAHRAAIQAKVALCVGATIDFLAGEKARAPLWMRKSGLEWLHRLATEPRRLAKRYARDAMIFPRLLWREWASR